LQLKGLAQIGSSAPYPYHYGSVQTVNEPSSAAHLLMAQLPLTAGRRHAAPPFLVLFSQQPTQGQNDDKPKQAICKSYDHMVKHYRCSYCINPGSSRLNYTG